MKQEIKITTPYIQLDQLLKFSGIALSGGEAKEMIFAGIVDVNGVTASERRKKIYSGDTVIIYADDVTIELIVTAEE